MSSPLVDPSPFDPVKERVRLKDKYKQAARSIIEALRSLSKPAYTHTELAAQFRVSDQYFDPDNSNFTDSEACLFQPLTVNELEEYKIHETTELTEDEDRYLHRFGDTFNDFLEDYPVSEHYRMYDRASDIVFYLEVFESKSEEKKGQNAISIEDLSYWDNIK